jgi:hypothetical protein
MSNKLTDTQLVLLSAASQREDLCLTPPTGARLAPVRKAAAKLLDAGLVKEVRVRKDAPMWRRDEETEQAFALKLTAAGLKAIAADANEDRGEAAPTGEHSGVADGEPQTIQAHAPDSVRDAETDAVQSQPVAPRAGTKIGDVIVMLEKDGGATIDEIVAATAWLPHTARAALTGLRKRRYSIVSDRSDRTKGTVYRIAHTTAVGEASHATEATAAAEGDSDHDAAANPPSPTVRKAARRTRRAA